MKIGMRLPGKFIPDLARMRSRAATWLIGICVLITIAWFWYRPFRGTEDLLVVCYDSSREFILEACEYYEAKAFAGSGHLLSQNAGSVRQAENIIRGLSADVVLLASHAEMDHIQTRTGCLDPDWESKFPDRSSPLYSTIVLLVRKSNPRQIREWADLYSMKVKVAMPDPRSSGAGRYAYLALLADAMKRHCNDENSANKEVRTLLLRMNLIPLGAQSAFSRFALSSREDVFLTWESEALRIKRLELGDNFEIVHPSSSIKAEPVVAIMKCQTENRGTTEAARAFIEFLYSAEGQRIASAHGLRSRSLPGLVGGDAWFPSMELFDVESVFGTWKEIHDRHLGPEGSFAYAMKIRSAREGGVE